jgi:pimeloyl-ACP methyl ester carboxylesterase
MKIFIWILIIIFVVAIAYLMISEPANAQLSAKIENDTNAKNLAQLETEINQSEAARTTIKKDNDARIVWANPDKKEKTEYVLVYIHGFSASWMEGYPVNFDFAKRYGCNMYLARLYGHGIDTTDALVDLTPENYLETAKKAVAIGRQLGEKVILMSTSTGGTLSLAIAAENPWIYGLILYSPNIEVVDSKSANFLTKPCGLCLGKLFHGKYMVYDDPPEVQKYWQSKYRLEAVRAMKRLVNATMTEETFKKIHQPLFLGYYYKDEEHQDPTVSVLRLLEMFDQVSTPESEKWKEAFPNAGVHPIASEILSKDFKTVESKTFEFAEKVLGMKPVSK